MSLNIYLTAIRPTNVFDYNITHNLGKMASEAHLYKVMWRPEELGITTAAQALPLLKEGLERLTAFPEQFQALNPSNGWGTYEGLVEAVKEYITACESNPDATITVSR